VEDLQINELMKEILEKYPNQDKILIKEDGSFEILEEIKSEKSLVSQNIEIIDLD
jgi:hypothetical protein